MEYDEERSTKLNHLLVLKDEIAIIENRIEPHDCGHMITTVNFLNHRVNELRSELESE